MSLNALLANHCVSSWTVARQGEILLLFHAAQNSFNAPDLPPRTAPEVKSTPTEGN